MERVATAKSQKGKKNNVEKKVGECFQWKANGQCSKGDSCSFTHDLARGNRCKNQKGKGPPSSPAPDTKAKTDGLTLQQIRQQRSEPLDRKAQIAVPIKKLSYPVI